MLISDFLLRTRDIIIYLLQPSGLLFFFSLSKQSRLILYVKVKRYVQLLFKRKFAGIIGRISANTYLIVLFTDRLNKYISINKFFILGSFFEFESLMQYLNSSIMCRPCDLSRQLGFIIAEVKCIFVGKCWRRKADSLFALRRKLTKPIKTSLAFSDCHIFALVL